MQPIFPVRFSSSSSQNKKTDEEPFFKQFGKYAKINQYGYLELNLNGIQLMKDGVPFATMGCTGWTSGSQGGFVSIKDLSTKQTTAYMGPDPKRLGVYTTQVGDAYGQNNVSLQGTHAGGEIQLLQGKDDRLLAIIAGKEIRDGQKVAQTGTVRLLDENGRLRPVLV